MRKDIYIGSTAYTKETILLSLEVLEWLQRQSIKNATTPSQIINNLLMKEINNVRVSE